jgi:hypothetical protein
MKKSSCAPIIIRSEGASPQLQRIKLGLGEHDEAWLQGLIHAYPALIPIADIEPGFGELVAIAREVPCGHGYIDNLYLTPLGQIVLVETKLWRNVQARREVVAQALDYVAALTGLGYDAFEKAALLGVGPVKPASIYAMVAERAGALDEADFIDAVSMNLKRGRMLVIALGDGIRQEAEALAGLLQSHAVSHFTFALVELATWRNLTTGELLAIPNTLAQTVMIERGIVTIEDGVPVVKPVPVSAVTKAQSISEAEFYEGLAKKTPGLPAAIAQFLTMVEPLGVYPDLKASLNLKYDSPESDKALNLASISKTGKLWTSYLHAALPEPIVRRYNQRLADCFGGVVADKHETYVSTNGSAAPLISQLLPEHATSWVNAIAELIAAVRADAREAGIA